MRRNLTYPKDGERRLRETIHQLKAENGQLRKENARLRVELANRDKPERTPPKEVPEERKPDPNPKETWRQGFLKSVRPTIEKRIKERK